jgi:hypothetical protein
MWRWVLLVGMAFGCASGIPKGRYEYADHAGSSSEPAYKMAEAACIERHGAGPDLTPVNQLQGLSGLAAFEVKQRQEKMWAASMQACMYRQGWVFVEEP